MSARKKHRGDAKLKTLKKDLQAKIFTRLEQGSYEECVKWLAGPPHRIETSVGALNDFWSWYPLSRAYAEADNYVTELEKLAEGSLMEKDASRLRDVMNALFLVKARKSGDFETFEAAFKLALKSEQARNDGRRITLLEKNAKQAADAKDVLTQELSQEEQNKRLRAILA
jgi:hypothetical protein